MAAPGLEKAVYLPASLQQPVWLVSKRTRTMQAPTPGVREGQLLQAPAVDPCLVWRVCPPILALLWSISPAAFWAPEFYSRLLHQNLPVLCPFSSVFLLLLSLSSLQSPLSWVTSNFSTATSGTTPWILMSLVTTMEGISG